MTQEQLEDNAKFLKQLRATSYGQAYYEEHKAAGLDYLGFGDWQQRYGRWLVDSLDLKGRTLLDVGCACGSIVRGFGEAGAIVQGIDVNRHMIDLSNQHWPDMTPILHVCDAVNLHFFPENQFASVHSAQVAEHWKPELVPFILKELARVTQPNGLFFCALDTEELFARQGRTLATEDPTHICVRTLDWWHNELWLAGWEVVTAQYRPTLEAHPESFLKLYDWDWWVARKVNHV